MEEENFDHLTDAGPSCVIDSRGASDGLAWLAECLPAGSVFRVVFGAFAPDNSEPVVVLVDEERVWLVLSFETARKLVALCRMARVKGPDAVAIDAIENVLRQGPLQRAWAGTMQ